MLTLGALPLVAQYSAYLPPPRHWVISPGYSFQVFDHFWAGDTRYSLSDLGISGELKQHTVQLGCEYGVSRRVAVDASVGYVRTHLPIRSEEGLTDSSLGIRYQLLREHRTRPSRPTLAVRLGAIVEGTYDLHLGLPPTHPGDGASGGELAVLFAKTLGRSGFTVYGDLGYRHRAEGVPADVFGTAGLSYGPAQWIRLNAAYRHEQSLSGVDILGPGFVGNWQEVREINRLVETGITLALPRSISWSLYASWNVSGRNTPDRTILGTYLSWTFGTGLK
jgi:hypothetical protein